MGNAKNNNCNEVWVVVRDYDFKCLNKTHKFSPATGERTVNIVADTSCIAGWGSERYMGFFQKKKIFVAVYPDNDSLILWIDGFQVDLRSKEITVVRKRLFGTFTYHVIIRKNTQIIKSFWYSFVTFESFPDDRDIFTCIAEMCKSRKSIEQAFFLNAARLQGRELCTDPKLGAELEEFLHCQLNG